MPKKPKRQKYRRLVGPVELPMTDAQFLRDAARQTAGQRIVGRERSGDSQEPKNRLRGGEPPGAN